MIDNPFEILKLDPSADEETAVRQAARLCQRAADEPARNQIRQAVRRLTTTAEERQLHALLTHPRPEYHCSVLDGFIAAHRRAPAVTDAGPPPEMDREEITALLLAALAAELEFHPLPLEADGEAEPAVEIARQTAEALWLGLLFDMRA